MSADSANLFDAALHLPDDDRASLAYQLLQSLKPPGICDEIDAQFNTRLEERAARFESGQSDAADWDDVAGRLREALREKDAS